MGISFSLLPLLFGLGSGLGLQGMPRSLVFWEWGCPKRGDAHENRNLTSIKVSMLFSYEFLGRNNNKTVRFGFRII